MAPPSHRPRLRPCQLALAALLWTCCEAKPGPPPKMPKGLPKGLMNQGPPWRQAVDKVFSEACQMNRGSPSVFCFPDKAALMEALQVEQYGLDLDGEYFLMDLYVVFKQLSEWPPAWALLIDVLDPKRPWTMPFCEKIIGSPWWSALPFVRRSFLSPRHTMIQLETDLPPVAASMNKWFDQIKQSGNSVTQKLVQDFRAIDTEDTKNRFVRGRPMIRLMQQVHARMVQHVFGTACKGSEQTLQKIQKNDTNGMTILHHVASLGDAAGAKAILKSMPKKARADFAAVRDAYGYRAEDWAKLGDFEDTVEVIRSLGGSATKKQRAEAEAQPPPPEPLSFLPPSSPAASEAEDGECSAEAGGDCAVDAAAGGWRRPDAPSVPPGWLPPAEQPCEFDAIDASQWDYEAFMTRYVLHPRPLLIRGGARLPALAARNFSREGLLQVAAERKLDLYRYSWEKEFDGTKPVTKTLAEYLEYLQGRTASNAAKKLLYVVERLPPEESYLNFSAVLPKPLAGKVIEVGTQFYLGGALMGAPLHRHGPSVNSLIFGRKLWYLIPPGRELVVNDAMYDYLTRAGGAPPESTRCVQEAGDVLFVPRGWSHGTVLLEDSIGMSQEFSHNLWDMRDQ